MLRNAFPLTWMLVFAATAVGEPLSPGEWLLHLGRDYPLSAQASATDADAQITLLFMQAATRVEPALPEPWYWQADMLTALNRPVDARSALGEYVCRAPQDVVTYLRWIELSTEAIQTADQRAEYWRKLLAGSAAGHPATKEAPPLPGEVRSDLHRRLAEFHWNRGEREQAQAEAQTAITDFRMNLAAGELLDEIQAQPQTPARRLELALTEVVLDPANAGQVLDIADLLTGWGMAADAEGWYAQADKLQELIAGKQSSATRPSATSRPAPGTQSPPAEARAMLDAFPKAVLDYPLNPTKYLSLTWQMAGPELPPGEPWRCTVRLKNIGSFPITFGAERMVFPDFMCSVTARGDQERTSGPTLRLPLNQRVRLSPGEMFELTTTLDLGSIRAAMIATPQIAHQVEVAGILSPIRLELNDGREAWIPSIGGMAAPPLRFRRTAMTASADRVRSLAAQVQSEKTAERVQALEVLSMLLAENQHLAAGRLRYSVPRIDPKMAQDAILTRVADADWQVRARLAECMRWFVLDAPATQAATHLLNDSNPIVRGLALRLLADQHRDKFLPVLKQTAQSDADDWVRRLAQALADRLAPAATQPAGS